MVSKARRAVVRKRRHKKSSTLIPGIWMSGVPVPSPESFVPEVSPFLYYGLFYFAGWQLRGRESLLRSLAPYGFHIVLGSTMWFFLYYGLMPDLDLAKVSLQENWQPSGHYTACCLLTAYLSTSLTLGSILIGMQYLGVERHTLKFVADSSSWVYLTHLPVILFLQTLLTSVPWSIWIKLSSVILLTYLFCVASYLVFVRYTPVGWLLHGKRPFP